MHQPTPIDTQMKFLSLIHTECPEGRAAATAAAQSLCHFPSADLKPAGAARHTDRLMVTLHMKPTASG